PASPSTSRSRRRTELATSSTPSGPTAPATSSSPGPSRSTPTRPTTTFPPGVPDRLSDAHGGGLDGGRPPPSSSSHRQLPAPLDIPVEFPDKPPDRDDGGGTWLSA